MLAMQLNLRFGPGSDEAAARATVLDCARRVTPRRDLVHACCLVDEAESICAPFYVWRTTGAMCRFLLGGPFKGVVDVYGRPRVRTWNVLEYCSADASVTPRFARREVDTVDAEDSLCGAARERAASQNSRPARSFGACHGNRPRPLGDRPLQPVERRALRGPVGRRLR